MFMFIWYSVSAALFIYHVVGTSGNYSFVCLGGVFVWKMKLLSIIEAVEKFLGIVFLAFLSHFLITYLPNRLTTAYKFAISTKLGTDYGIDYGLEKSISIIFANYCFSRSTEERVVAFVGIHPSCSAHWHTCTESFNDISALNMISVGTFMFYIACSTLSKQPIFLFV